MVPRLLRAEEMELEVPTVVVVGAWWWLVSRVQRLGHGAAPGTVQSLQLWRGHQSSAAGMLCWGALLSGGSNVVLPVHLVSSSPHAGGGTGKLELQRH